MPIPENNLNPLISAPSLQEHFTQAAFNDTVQQVMTDPGRDFSDITQAAIAADMDIIYGEHHGYIHDTMRQIVTALQNAPEGRIKAVSLETPVETQTLFEPAAFMEMDQNAFVKQYYVLIGENLQNEADIMLERGDISPQQHEAVEIYVNTQISRLANSVDQPHFDADRTVQGAIYHAAKAAIEKGIPVIANDMNRERGVAAILSSVDDESVRMSPEEVMHFMEANMDDRSDVAQLEAMGVDVQGDGVLLVHRGYYHINNSAAHNGEFYGYDEVLESMGRSVLTVGILPEDMHYSSPEDADFYIKADGYSEMPDVNRIRYIKPDEAGELFTQPLDTDQPVTLEEEQPIAPGDINSPKPGF